MQSKHPDEMPLSTSITSSVMNILMFDNEQMKFLSLCMHSDGRLPDWFLDRVPLPKSCAELRVGHRSTKEWEAERHFAP